MRVRLVIGAAVFILMVVGGCASTRRSGPPPQTVAFVDLERYAGLWYQVARYPHSFQRKECRLSTARYTLLDDARVEVRNDCWVDEVGGERAQTVGAVARPYNESNSWLKVSFFGIFPADYLIIELDLEYEWAVVTTPDRNTLWILSREPQLEEGLYESIVDRLVERGFVRDKIIRTSLQ